MTNQLSAVPKISNTTVPQHEPPTEPRPGGPSAVSMTREILLPGKFRESARSTLL